MRILAIETVETTGSVAAFDDGGLLAEAQLDTQRRSAQTLAPAIRDLLAQVGWRPTDVELVAVATGPGSFTGLRIGVTTAKTFAYAVGCQVQGVHTLLAIAARAPKDVTALSAVLDAQRGELFVADFRRDASGNWTGAETTRIEIAKDWLAALASGTHVTGPGLAKLADRLPPGVVALDQSLWKPTATVIGPLAWQQYSAGHRENLFDLVPHYFRRTAAEEQWDRKQLGT